MSKSEDLRQRKEAEASVRGTVVIVDDKPDVRDDLSKQFSSQFGDRCTVFEAESGTDALDLIANLQFSGNVAVVAVDLSLGVEESIDAGLSLIRELRQQLPTEARILAYTLLPMGGNGGKRVLDAGPSSFVRADDVGPVITRVFLEHELHELQASSPLVARVLDTMGVGISIQDPDMNVLFLNQRTEDKTGVAGIIGKKCWRAYHGFLHRSHPCTNCVPREVIKEARQKIEWGEDAHSVEMTGTILHPIKGSLACVEVNAAPLLSSDGTKVLAVIEASRVITEEWKKKLAHTRLNEAIEEARRLGRHEERGSEFASLSVYYRPEGTQDLHLFDFVRGPGVPLSPSLLRYEELPPEYGAILQDRKARTTTPLAPTDKLWHFLWCHQSEEDAPTVLIDVAYSDKKPEGLFKQDLLPYWEYVAETFEEALESREKTFRAKTQAVVAEFLREVGEKAKGYGDEHRIVESVVRCVKKALSPASMYIRTLDRKANSLVKQQGFGPFSEMAPPERILKRDGFGGAEVARTRKGIWEERATPEMMLAPDDQPNDTSEKEALKRISSYVVLPLVFSQRVLGTFSVQFEDDSLFSEAKRDFLNAIAGSLGATLGRVEWSKERQQMALHFRKLDSMMFTGESPGDSAEDEEKRILELASQMVFDLTFAGLVLYYRYNEPDKKLELVACSGQDTLPADAKIPKELPADVGLAGRAVAMGRPQIVDDYDEMNWRQTHERLLAALPDGPGRETHRWVSCEVATPVKVGHELRGVLLAASPIPRWLSEEDKDIISEFAFKIGLCLAAKEVDQRLRQELLTMTSMNAINGEMGRTSDKGALHRLLLLAVTVGECLGFSRAVLFVMQQGNGKHLKANLSVGSDSRKTSRGRWREAKALDLDTKIQLCLKEPSPPKPGDILDMIRGESLDLVEETQIRMAFARNELAVRRCGEEHILKNPRLRQLLSPEGEEDVEYVLAPLNVDEELVGVVLADRAFVVPAEISDQTLNLLGLLTRESSLILQTLEHRRKEQETRVAEELARGVSYSLRSRAALLEADLWLLKQDVGQDHARAILDMEESVEFFKRSGTLASKHIRIEKLGVEDGERFDLKTLVAETADAFHDSRIDVVLSDKPLPVKADMQRIEDVFVEILLNARDITDKGTGRITVEIRSEGTMARVEVKDNGPGIHPRLRPHLFGMFQCYPAGRMGLGLSYARTVVTAYGGTIDEIGKDRHGAHFVVRIPLTEE